MNHQPRPPIRHGPPRRGATAGDTMFALAIAALGLVLAGALFAAGGGAPWLAGYLPGALAHGEPGGASRAPAVPASGGPIAPASASPGLPSSAAPASASPSVTPPATPAPAPAATPRAAAGPFTMNLYRKGVFVHQVNKETCVAAAVQNTLNVIRLVEQRRKPDASRKTQLAIYDRVVKLTTRKDSHNGGTGPGGWAAFLSEEGYPYELRVYETRNQAIAAAALAIRATRRPAGILAWAGVHSWVMTGFTATADPASGKRFAVTTAYVLDPWYPWVSTRWPRSEAPNQPRDAADLRANIRPWKVASGPYPERDGKYLVVVPLAP
jgi:hypothetical protein